MMMDREKLQRERAALELEKLAMTTALANEDDIIELNVGGERMSTLR